MGHQIALNHISNPGCVKLIATDIGAHRMLKTRMVRPKVLIVDSPRKQFTDENPQWVDQSYKQLFKRLGPVNPDVDLFAGTSGPSLFKSQHSDHSHLLSVADGSVTAHRIGHELDET